MKQLCDNLFVSGINHHVYHGTAYSPANAAWPGWLFYASAQLNPQNSIWRDISKLNEYVTRSQTILQEGESANDLLVYFPIHDIFQDPNHSLAPHLHIGTDWLSDTASMASLRSLWQRGYAFDYISDLQLNEVHITNNLLMTTGGQYRAIVIPSCEYMPAETLKVLHNLFKQGAKISFLSPAPEDIPGYLGRQKENREQFKSLMAEMDCFINYEEALSRAGIQREEMVDRDGLLFIRRKHDTGYSYFLINESNKIIDDFIPLTVQFKSVLIMDPMSGKTGSAQKSGESENKVRIQLEPGASLVLRTSNKENPKAMPWFYTDPCGEAFILKGTWQVDFIQGGPELTDSYETDTLFSWADHDQASARFAGTASYRLEFDAPSEGSKWLIDLGQVHSSARV